MNGSALLDTNLVIAHLRSDAALTQRLRHASPIHVPWIVLGELYFGAHKSNAAAKILHQVQRFMSGTIVLYPDDRTTEEYGEIKAVLARAGTPIPDNDIWIAAAARRFQLPLATRDQHFGLVKGLSLLAW